jgi:hypothetical protein
MKRFIQAFALGMGIAAVVQIILPARPHDTTSPEPATLGKGIYRLMLYCSSLSGQYNCTDLQDINEHQFESISKVTSDIGPSGVEIKACEWTAFNCISNPNEELRDVTRSLLGAALATKLGATTGAGGPDEGANDAPRIQQSSSNGSRMAVTADHKTAVGLKIK